jgi:glycosyltransferase involved in cell wall biosynthesis/thymidylate kinase
MTQHRVPDQESGTPASSLAKVSQTGAALQALQTILAAMEAISVRYAMIHHADDLEGQLQSDIDLVLDRHPAEVLDPILRGLRGLQLIQRLHYEIPYGYYYVLNVAADRPCFLHLDVVFDPWGCNHYLYTSEELLQGRRQLAGIWTTAPEKEATYLLIKKAIKGDMDSETHALIRRRVAQAPESSHKEMLRWFGTAGTAAAQKMVSAEATGDWPTVLADLRDSLRRALYRRGGLWGMRRHALEAHRRLIRMLHPAGLFVVLIGPDGSGKSTLVERTLSVLQRGFRKTWRFHWRPGLLPKLSASRPSMSAPSRTSVDGTPPASHSYGHFVSLIRYLYYLADFVIGYWTIIYPKKIRTTLILGERWYYDVIVNPARYGFRVPERLLRLGLSLIPAPDLTLLLEADPAAIHARKPELTVCQLENQLRAMHAILPEQPNGLSISTSGNVSDSVHAMARALLGTQQRRITPADGMTWRAFPDAKNPKLWIHEHDTVTNALNLYHPYSKFARMASVIARRIPRWLCTRRPSISAGQQLGLMASAIQRMLGHDDLVISFSTGTPGPHRKTTAQVSRSGAIICYVKIAASATAKTLLDAETRALARLDGALANKDILIPRLLGHALQDGLQFLALSAPPTRGKRRPVTLDVQDIDALSALLPPVSCREPVEYVLDAAGFGASHRGQPGIFPSCLVHACDMVATLLADGVYTGLAHGDYAPWNTLALETGQIFVYDWEYSTAAAPLLTDLCHRIFMPARLVEHMTAEKLIPTLLALDKQPLAADYLRRSGIQPASLPAYLLLYLIRQAAREISEQGTVTHYLQECLRLMLTLTNHPEYRVRVLVSAYACEPHKGSEPGVGWDWAQTIALNHDAWIITRANNRSVIETELRANPNPHLHFTYVDLPRWASFWKRGHRGVRTYYYLWQFAAWMQARSLCRETHFHLAHHVTFVNDWLWTFMAFLPLPFVWGPIGSNARCPSHLLPSVRARNLDLFRIMIQNTVRWCDPLWWLSAIRASAIVTINDQVARQLPLRLLAAHKTRVETAVAVTACAVPDQMPAREGNRILYVGRHLPIKGGALAIEAFAKIVEKQPQMELVLIGEGPEERTLRRMVHTRNLEDRVTFLPWQPQTRVWDMMNQADVFLFPSMEGAGMVVLEAMRAGLPVVCLQFGGPGTMVTEEVGRTVPIGSLDEVTSRLAREAMTLLNDPALRASLGNAARRRTQVVFSWAAKQEIVSRLYRDILLGDSLGETPPDYTHAAS